MAIEFKCPNCSATVRVGDDAVGKVGSCPQCRTKLRVPNPTVSSESQPTEESNAQAPTESLPQTQPVRQHSTAESQNVSLPDHLEIKSGTGVFPDVPVGHDPVTSKYLRKRRRKRSTSLVSILVPLLFGSLLCLAGLAYYLNTLPNFKGKIEGTLIDSNRSLQVKITADDHDVPTGAFQSLVNQFEDEPAGLRSELVSLQFTGGSETLNVSLRPGVGSDLVKVRLLTQLSLKEFYRENFDRLDQSRRDEISRELAALCVIWSDTPAHLRDELLTEHRHSVVYNSFVQGLGRICQAVVGSQAYPCVHENSDGEFFFLVPTGVNQFSIQERTDLKDTPYFPSEFRIDVVVTDESSDESGDADASALDTDGRQGDSDHAESLPDDSEEAVDTQEVDE